MSLFATRQDLFRVGRRAIVGTPNLRITPAVADVPGSDLNVVIGVSSVMGEEVSSRSAVAMRGAFAELARGPQLDRVIYDRSGLLRFSATPATVALTFSRPTPGSPTPGTLAAESVIQTTDGVQFALDSDAVFGDATTTVTVNATALIAGVNGNVQAGSLTVFGASPFDATLTVTNAAAAAGGTDEESDAKFLGRYRGFFPTITRGILGAIEYAAKQVPGCAVATATEIVNPFTGFPAAFVQLVVGDLDGNASPTMLQQVSDKLIEYRCCGIPVLVVGGSVVYQAINWKLAFQTGFDESLIVSRVRAVTVAVSQFLPPGPQNGILYRSSLISAARKVPGAIVADSALALPMGDVVPADATKMIRIRSTEVTFG